MRLSRIYPYFLLAICAFVVWDYWPINAARNELAKNPPTLDPVYTKQKNDLARDLAVHKECGVLRLAHGKEYRDCLVDALASVKTGFGGVVLGGSAWSWVRDHPDDDEMRSAALQAIPVIRKWLLAEYLYERRRLYSLYDSYRQSMVIGRFVENPVSVFDDSKSMYAMLSKHLDYLEFSFASPETRIQQEAWERSVWLATIDENK